MRTIHRRFPALLLLFSLLLTVSGCAGLGLGGSGQSGTSGKPGAASSQTASAASTRKTLSLPYAYTRTLNPFAADSAINLAVWPLLYDTLAEPEDTFDAQLNLASSIQNNGTTVTVFLNSGVTFTDGTALTPADVVYSFNLALGNPSGNFYSRVSNIASVAAGQGCVVFTLKSPDPLVGNSLDVPIIKAGSDHNAGAPPTGSGRYTFHWDGQNADLNPNTKWFRYKSFPVKSIKLINMPDNTAVEQCLEIGTVDYLMSDYGSGMPTNVSVVTQNINQNELMYIGVNATKSALSDAHVRRAISEAVDRKEIAQDIFSSHLLASTLPFNPAWSGTPKTASSAYSSDVDAAKSELARDGYTQKDSNGTLTKTDKGVKKTLEFNLLVNKDDTLRLSAAQRISLSLKNVGIMLNVKQADYNTYLADIHSGQFDLYIGQVQIPYDMDLSAFLSSSGAASAGVPAGGNFRSAYAAWKQSGGSVDKACSAFGTEMPFIPLGYKLDFVSYQHNFYTNIKATGDDIFFNIENWVG